MQIDWFTLGAQLVNFLILVGLLKRFLYGPITEAMDAREARIAARLDEAEAKRQEAEREAEAYRAQQEALADERRQRLDEAEAEAEARRQALVQKAREEVGRLEREWHEALRRDRDAFLRTLSHRSAREAIAVARRALDDLAGADLEARTVARFLERMRRQGMDALAEAVESHASADRTVVVRSAFPLGEAQQRAIREGLRERWGADVAPAFEVEEALGFGIELRVGERKIAWTLAGYLDALTTRVQEQLDAELERVARVGREAPMRTPEPAADEEEE